MNWLARILKSRLFPGILQWPTAFVFAAIIYQLLYGPASSSKNFGTSMTWVLWWPIIPLIFFIFGRMWCAICPFATLSDIIQKFFGNNKPVPQFLKKYGIWIIDALFILITWADHVFGIVDSPRGSGILLLMIIAGVITMGAFFERRAWCKYLCFLGGVAGNYSRCGAIDITADPQKCKTCKVKACFNGNDKVAGCPMFGMPRTIGSDTCNLCGNCFKTCPNNSVVAKVRVPGSGLWIINKPRLSESSLAVVIMSIVFVQNATMLEVWAKAQSLVEAALGTTNYGVIFTMIFSVAVLSTIGAMAIASGISSFLNKESPIENFARFGYAFIPLDLAAHMAHNLFHLLAEGLNVLYTALALFGINISGSNAILDGSTISVLQYILLGVGTIGSVVAALKLNKGRPGIGVIPILTLIIVFLLVNIYLFLLPMSHRV
ncbi:MAG: 4Fe-4S binding protein [Eubacteriales bacterium]